MEDSSVKTHRLADTTFRNNEELSADLHRLATAAKTYYKAMQGLEQASRQFHGVLGSIASKAANLPGGVRKLGDAAEDLVTGYNHVQNQFRGLMHSMNTDFIVPLETKLDAEEKNLMDMHKTYRQENGKRESPLSKTRDQIRSLKKKKLLTNAQREKLAQLKQIESDQTECLHQTRVEGLRKALLEERKLYCFVLDHLTSVIRNEVAYNATSHEELSTRLNELRTLTSSPNELPEESAALLIDPRSSRAFPPSPHDDMPDIGEDKAPMEVESTIVMVKAIHPHKPTDSSQLEFKMGDLIEADENSQQNGWRLGKNLRTGV
jgi:BAI1-associated protein 2